MTSVSHILVGTDFSDPAEVAVRTAATWASAFDAKVTLAHVLSVPELPEGILAQPHPEHAELEEAVHEHLDRLRERLLSGIDAKTVMLRGGHPAEALIEVAEGQGVDLIVVATHGRSGLQRFLLGSVAERVTKLAKCAVMTVPLGPDEG